MLRRETIECSGLATSATTSFGARAISSTIAMTFTCLFILLVCYR